MDDGLKKICINYSLSIMHREITCLINEYEYKYEWTLINLKSTSVGTTI